MILSDYERKDSPWVWLQFAIQPGDPKQYRKTEIRKTDPHKRRRIAKALRDLEAELLATGAAAGLRRSGWDFVEDWLRGRYSSPSQASTLAVYLKQWRPLRDFFEAEDVPAPALLERQHAYDYLEARKAQVKEKSGKLVSHNTARGELKLLGMIMDEAVAQRIAIANPVRKLRIGEEEFATKPEISAAEEAIIRPALRSQDPWMQLSFHIGISTGLRFADTRIPLAAVRWESDDILVEKPKGGHSREFSIPIYETIRPQLQEMRTERRRYLYEIPPGVWSPSMAWREFFDGLGLQHLCFHCTRVTFISRGMRAGIPEPVMMKMVNHGSKLISRIYQRWTADDVRQWAARMPGA